MGLSFEAKGKTTKFLWFIIVYIYIYKSIQKYRKTISQKCIVDDCCFRLNASKHYRWISMELSASLLGASDQGLGPKA